MPGGHRNLLASAAQGGDRVGRWIVLLHVLAAFWFVGGLLGRDVTLGRARHSRDIDVVAELVSLAGIFERSMVQPGSIAVLVGGVSAVWARGYEAMVVVGVVVLMVTKPS
jgi:hypothetical protein